MTLHVITVTPEHILCVSDRLITTSGNSVEVDDDRFKHVTLQTDDARAVISFAGFAGKLNRYGILNETTADWITNVLVDTMEAGHHGINQHLTDLKDRIKKYHSELKQSLPLDVIRLAIIVSGWAGSNAFNCVIDNCIETDLTWLPTARDSIKVRKKEYAGDPFLPGCYVLFPINAPIAKKYVDLRRQLQSKAILGDVEGMFDASVQIIHAVVADPESMGKVGTKCSGIHMPRDSSLFLAQHRRHEKQAWTLIPNLVISTSRYRVVVQNDEVHPPKPPAKLVYLISPDEADTPQKRLAFWQRAVERLRLLHNEYGAEVRERDLKYTRRRFHEWQRNEFNPVDEATLNEMNRAILELQWQEPDSYGVGLSARPVLALKQKNKQDTTWDDFIDLRDVTPFE